jgi:hypothetical protein
MRFLLYLLLCSAALLPFSTRVSAQSRDEPEEEIMREGQALYQSERASWVATDIFMASIADRSLLGGYLSYTAGDSVRTLFFSRLNGKDSAEPQVLADFTFPKQDIRLETSRRGNNRATSPAEKRLFTLREQVIREMKSGKMLGEPYQVPAKCNLNIVLLTDATPRAYLITGPQENLVVPIGNDYLLSFDGHDRLVQAQKLHNTYLPFKADPTNKDFATGIHTHLTAHPYITPTDICSLLLYNHVYPMEQHYVMGQKYVSILAIREGKLVILEKKVFDRIAKSNQKEGFKK